MSKSKVIILTVVFALLYMLVSALIAIGVPYFSYKSAKVEVNTDINKYSEYIGKNAREEYRNKWDMDESIFPEKISDTSKVEDYKMVYYSPWDAQYLSYLVISYNEQDYKDEVKRLEGYNSTDYIGYYSVTGFDKYKLLAMNADSYNGFVYALTDGKSKIIYVELIFCNYFYDLDYKDYIDEDYLPNGFDAKPDNSYQLQMTSNYF